MTVKRRPGRGPLVHPGEVLRDELNERGLSIGRFARDLGVSRSRMGSVLRKQTAITPDTAVRLALYFGGDAEFWLNLQRNYDLALFEAEYGEAVRAQVRVPA